MDCPRDGTELNAVQDSGASGIWIHQCPSCQGLWTPKDTFLVLADKAKVSLPDDFFRRPPTAAHQKNKISCPKDGEAMFENMRGGVHLDFCAACGGVWFDADELGRVLKHIKPGRLRTLERADRGFPVNDDSGLGMLIYGFADLFSGLDGFST